VVLFRLNGLPLPKHCAILVAPDRFIHAQERLGVVEIKLSDSWQRRIATRFTFPPIESP
jgi:cell wall-associated NlpC family hydrolase